MTSRPPGTGRPVHRFARILLALSVVCWVGFWVALVAEADHTIATALFLCGLPGLVTMFVSGRRRRNAER
jgi:hypothetical protein